MSFNRSLVNDFILKIKKIYHFKVSQGLFQRFSGVGRAFESLVKAKAYEAEIERAAKNNKNKNTKPKLILNHLRAKQIARLRGKKPGDRSAIKQPGEKLQS